MDTVSKKKRSEIMSRIRGRDTAPEMIVRRVAHRMGYRFRLHVRGMPGSPDLVFPSRRKAIFVHGCFWHRHKSCRHSSMPSTRVEFWRAKLRGNVVRDRRNVRQLENDSWRVLVIWECQVESRDWLSRQLVAFLEKGRILKVLPTGRKPRKAKGR